MNTDRTTAPAARALARPLLAAAIALSGAVHAQTTGASPAPPPGAGSRPAAGTPTLSSPLGPGTPPPSTAVPSAPPGAAGVPAPGSGPGFHDPRSAFKPLQERDGVVSWKLLSSVKARIEKDKVIPEFPAGVRALNARPVKVQGFMMPLEPGEKQRHFLLSAVPTTCNFCIPAGPEGLIEVRTREPVRYTVEAVTIEGRMAVLSNDKYGLFYRVEDARQEP